MLIFISFDDLRHELGCYGNNEILTPNLDKLADQGVAFLNTYCQVAVCQPSPASYMTGIFFGKSKMSGSTTDHLLCHWLLDKVTLRIYILRIENI